MSNMACASLGMVRWRLGLELPGNGPSRCFLLAEIRRLASLAGGIWLYEGGVQTVTSPGLRGMGPFFASAHWRILIAQGNIALYLFLYFLLWDQGIVVKYCTGPSTVDDALLNSRVHILPIVFLQILPEPPFLELGLVLRIAIQPISLLVLWFWQSGSYEAWTLQCSSIYFLTSLRVIFLDKYRSAKRSWNNSNLAIAEEILMNI